MTAYMNMAYINEQLDALYKEGNGQSIQTFLEDHMAESLRLGDSHAQIALANELGGLYRAQGHLEAAKDLYKKALRAIEELGLGQSLPFATTLINAGDVYVADRQYDQAIRLFKEAQDVFLKLGKGDSYEMAALKNNLSAAYRELGDYAQASQLLEDALRIISTYPERKAEEATSRINLAQLFIRQGEFTKAEDLLLQTLAYYEAKTTGGDPHYPLALAAMGEVYYFKSDYERSEGYYQKALLAIENYFGKNPIYDTVKENLLRVQKLRMGLS